MTGSPVRAVSATAFTVPTPQPEADGTLTWDSTTMVVVTAEGGGQCGTGWTYGSSVIAPLVRDRLAGVVVGRDLRDVPGSYEAMRRDARNLGVPGLVAMAISAVDVALWDLKARCLGVGVSALLGRFRPGAPIYGSGGFTTLRDDQLRDQLAGWVHRDGIDRVKIKIAESWGGDEARDLRRVELARETIGEYAELFVDANGGYQAKQAIRMGRRFAGCGVTWFEEPVSSDDLDGLAAVRDGVEADVAAGEYGSDPWYFRRMCPAVDCVQIDATRAGGYTGFLAAAAAVGSFGRQVSAHCAPYLHASVAVATPNLRHVEFFADHTRIADLLFEGLPERRNGELFPDPDRPGHGMTLRAAEAAQYRVA